jgi:glycine dehydrogenase subunit 1
MGEKQIAYPYMPNSVGEAKEQMLKEIGVSDVMELFAEIPEHLRFQGRMDLPEPILDECSIRRHLEGLLNKNRNCADHLNFLGAGCAQHFVPAVCDEINNRGEFLTAYSGFFWADHGKWQAWFEYQSLMGELLDMDFLSLPQYDGTQAAASSLRVASAVTGRKEVLLPESMNPEVLLVLRNYLNAVGGPAVRIELVAFDRKTGLLDVNDLKSKISSRTAAVYIENPGYLGLIEAQCEEIGTIARENGAEFVVYVDPISLGVMKPPAQYGATIACGDFHPLGLHMQCGGGQAGFMAASADMEHASQFKDIMVGLAPTVKEGEYGFGAVLPTQISYFAREQANEYTGTNVGLWAITAAVYLSLMGPKGMQEIGRTIMQKAQYASRRISQIEGIELGFSSPFFKEFVVNLDKTGKTVAEVNRALLDHKIFGGKDISAEFAELGQSALFCVTEIISREDIEVLVGALQEATQ